MGSVNDNGSAGNGGIISLMRRASVLIVLAAAVVGAILYWQKADHAPQVVQSHAQSGPMPVRVVVMQPKDVPLSPEYLGQTEASQTVEIRARVNGFLQSMNFKEGGTVKAGQLLFRIDPRSFQASLDKAQAQLASAEAQLQRAEQKVRRYTKLIKSDAVTEDELEEWQTEKNVAQANIELQKAEITQAKLDLSYTSVKSPIEGRIGMAQKDVGSYVDSSSTNGVLAKVEKIDPIYVRYTLSEQDLLQARRMAESGETSLPENGKLRLKITLADGTDYPYEGEITYSDPEIDPDTGSSVMRGTFPNPDGELLPGQFVRVHVSGVERLNALLVPKNAVVQNPTGAMVYVVNDEMEAEFRPVTLGSWQGEQWIVKAGLKPGDKVIVDKLMSLRPGVKIEPIAAAKAEVSNSSQGRTKEEM